MANYSDIKYQPAGSATTTYSDMAALIAATGMSAGDQALVTSLNKVFMYTGSAWYLVATMTNDSPTAITGVDGTYTLAIDGTATTITAVSTDPEGFALTWSYAVTSGSLGSTATVSQADNVFTVTPSTNSAHEGNFSITFSVTDGATGAVSAVSSFTLAFSVTNSRYTSLSVKATNTGSNQTFDDASTSNHTITVAGDTTASTFSPHRHGGYAINFDGSGDSLTVPDSTDFDIASDADFTLELWGFYRSFATQSHFVDTRGTSQGVFLTCSVGGGGSDDGKIKFYTNSGNRIITASTVPLNSWVHIALVRYSGTTKIYINGTADSNTYSDTNTYIALDWNIGKRSPIQTGSYMEGLFSDYRFVNGTAVYTSNFAPPTEPLTAITNTKLLLGNLPYFKDQSASNHTITLNGNVSLAPKSVFDNSPYSEASHGASAYFDGTGDYISTANHADFNFGSGNFTIESYVYYTPSPTTNQVIVAQWHTGGGNNRRAFQLRRNYGSTGSFRFYWSTDGSDYPYIESTGIDLNTMHNQWIHVAVVRNGNTITMYVNGTDVVNTTLTGSLYDNTTDDIFIGSRSVDPPNIDHQTEGYISDVRVVKGTAIYTSNFTPPTAPLTAITNTKFLLNPETSISDLTQINRFELVGSVAGVSSPAKFANTNSMSFPGVGHWMPVFMENGTKLSGTEDWTVEAWVYPTQRQSYSVVVSCGSSFALALGMISGNFNVYSNVAGGFSDTIVDHGTYDIPANQWTHVAATRYNGIWYTYVDGTLRYTRNYTNEVNHVMNETTQYTIGAVDGYSSFTGNERWYGNIQDVRITKGLARYTANFTPPTEELQG